jgi:superfamily I DNA/RNA helicase
MGRIKMHAESAVNSVNSMSGKQYNVLGSDEQVAIWKALDNSQENIIVNACAGTGKTWTLTEWAKAQTSGRIALVAFNKHIADELKLRIGDNQHVEPMTYHSLGFKQIRKAYGSKVQVDQYKLDSILDNIKLPVRDEWQSKQAKYKIRHLVSLAKQSGMSQREDLEYLVDHHGIEVNGNEELIYATVPTVMEACKADKHSIDFDDMIWLPKELGLSTKQYDVMLTDESQDLSSVQQWLAKNSADRLVMCGDRRQAIYGWRGSDDISMDRMKDELAKSTRGCIELPLNVTRRCPKSHVELAKRIVPQITALNTADEGVVSTLKADIAVNSMRPGDLVVCRVNAELLGVAYKLLKRGVKAVVRGRDLGAGLEKLIDKCMKKGASNEVRDLLSMAGDITTQETDKYLAIPHGRGEMRAANSQDRYGCLCELAVDCKTVSELRGVITRLFADFDDSGKPNNAVVLGTIHRTKGLEANRVFVLRGDLIPHPMAKIAWQASQELNAAYIAVTRSKYELIWVGQPSRLFVD